MNGHTPHSLENLHIVDNARKRIIHYTCSAPSEEILKKYGIIAIGKQFGCANPREVLEIPIKVYHHFGFYDLSQTALILNLERFVEVISKKR